MLVYHMTHHAGVAELADAQDLKSCELLRIRTAKPLIQLSFKFLLYVVLISVLMNFQEQDKIIEYAAVMEFGRHKGLKIPRFHDRTGSSPVSGTKNRFFME